MRLATPLTSEARAARSEEHTSELQSQSNLVCRLLLEKKKHRLTCAVYPLSVGQRRLLGSIVAAAVHLYVTLVGLHRLRRLVERVEWLPVRLHSAVQVP